MGLLDSDLTGVDISRPLIKPGPVEFTIGEIRVEPNKDRTKENLLIILRTKHREKSTKGEDLNPGFTITHRVSITPTEKYTEERIMQELKKFRLAVTGDKSGAFAPIDQYLNRDVIGTVSVESDETGQYADQNRVKNWVERTGK